MAKIIFVAGLDNREGDISAQKQAELLKKGWGSDLETVTFRYVETYENNNNIQAAIKNNPDAPVVLFSAGCGKTNFLAKYLKSLGRDVKTLYANEPYTEAVGVLNIILAAVGLGMPSSNVFSGPYPGVGSNVSGSTKLPGRTNHFDSLTALGKYLKKIYGDQPAPPAQESATNTPGGSQSGTQSDTASTTTQGNTDPNVTGQESSRGDIVGQGDGKSTQQKTLLNPVFITQILDPKLKGSTIRLTLNDQAEYKKDVAQNLGNFPLVYYGSYQIEFRDIQYFKLSTSGNLPTITMIFRDTLSLMKDKAFPLDDTKITVFINPRSDQLRPIHMDFKIVKFDAEGRIYTLTATIDANQLYIKKFKSFSSKTSFDVLKSIAEEAGLGFASNVDSTSDSMTWINPGKKYFDFIDDIVRNSYKSDETYLNAYVDYYYNLTYVDVEKEMRRNIKEEFGVANLGIHEMFVQNKEIVSKLVLTNNMTYRSSNNYFKEHRVINNSSSISLSKGYSTKLKYYDEIKKDFLVFRLDSLTSDAENKIILKGRPQDDQFINENLENIYLGKIDIDNSYTNYHYSQIQNNRNILELNKVVIEVVMKTPNFNFYKFQKVLVAISSQTPTPSNSIVNSRLSGEWLIVDIQFVYDKGVFEQIIKLTKRELDLSPDEAAGEVASPKRAKDTNRGNTQNPDTGAQDTTQRPAPNQVANTQESATESTAQQGDVPANVEIPSSAPATTPLVVKIPYQGVNYFYIKDGSDGIAGKRLRKLFVDLQAYLRANGYSNAVIKSLGVMRDLVAAGNPDNIPARAAGSLHGSGLAHDAYFVIPGIKWAGISDNQNLARDKNLTKVIWKFVQSQGDITWGAEWGKGVNLAKGETNGHGITEYHHFEIKATYIPDYWKPYESEIKKFGFDYRKLRYTYELKDFYQKLLKGRR